MKPEPLTYSQLLANQALSVQLEQLNGQTAANRATALRQFLRVNHLQEDDVVGLEMRPHYPMAMERLLVALREEGRSDRSISNTKAALTPWKLAVIADDTARAVMNSQPTPLVAVLRKSLEGHPVETVARQCGVPRDMLIGWLGGKSPRARNSMYLRRIESFFGMEKESLVTLAGITGSERTPQQVGTVHPIEYRETLGARSRSRYYLVPPIDSPLREQWRDFMRYKTAPLLDLQRSPTGRWTFSPLQVIQETDANWSTFLNGVEIPTAKAVWSQVAAFLGWLALPREEGGLAMCRNDLQTLAWFAVPGLAESYLEWLKKRCGGKRTKSTAEFLSFTANVVREKVGYLTQQPAFLITLPMPYSGMDWQDMCVLQRRQIEQLQQAYANEFVLSRDTFEPIRCIIDLPQPLEAMADMVQRMRSDRPMGCATSEAIWARDILMVKLFLSNPVRLRNMAALTWSPSNVDHRHPTDKGCLYQRGDGSWWLFVPKPTLKNRRGGVIDTYDSPVHPSVWVDLERYLMQHREKLMRWPTDLVFLNRKRDPERTESIRYGKYKKSSPDGHRPFMEMSKRLVVLTRKYLWKSDGIGTHAFRHIVATSILKTDGGDIKTAALVLNDAEATVAKHYSGMRSGDGAKRMGDLLGKTFNRM